MKRTVTGTNDPDFLGSEPALRRAAKRALRMGLKAGTPVYVFEDGKIIDLTKEHEARKGAPKRRPAGRNGRSRK
jgi:hypothetical protein